MKTVSLELAKQLKENGYPQVGNLYFAKRRDQEDASLVNYPTHDDELWETFASPTADELLDQLPMPIDSGGGKMYRLWINREPAKDRIELIYANARNSHDYFLTVADTLADAAAKMWLYLKKEKLI